MSYVKRRAVSSTLMCFFELAIISLAVMNGVSVGVVSMSVAVTVTTVVNVEIVFNLLDEVLKGE